MLRLIRENYERSLYEGEEYLYWQKINTLQEKLELLNKLPEGAIDRAARTLLDLRESWQGATKKERRDLFRLMIQEVACDLETKDILWIRVKPDFVALYQLLDGLRPDEERRFWILPKFRLKIELDLRERSGHKRTEVKTFAKLSHNSLTTPQEDLK